MAGQADKHRDDTDQHEGLFRNGEFNPFTPPTTEASATLQENPAPFAATGRFSWKQMASYSLGFAFGAFLLTGIGLTGTSTLFWIASACAGAFGGALAYGTSWAIRRWLFGSQEDEDIQKF